MGENLLTSHEDSSYIPRIISLSVLFSIKIATPRPLQCNYHTQLCPCRRDSDCKIQIQTCDTRGLFGRAGYCTYTVVSGPGRTSGRKSNKKQCVCGTRKNSR